eukprot:m.297 g.297  ORF g.297 m.297 type:complete len:60 (+) comp1477_c0_seq1:112-291(+)
MIPTVLLQFRNMLVKTNGEYPQKGAPVKVEYISLTLMNCYIAAVAVAINKLVFLPSSLV